MARRADEMRRSGARDFKRRFIQMHSHCEDEPGFPDCIRILHRSEEGVKGGRCCGDYSSPTLFAKKHRLRPKRTEAGTAR
jgi:hypothetical protein